MFFSEIIRGGLIQKSVGNNLENAGDDVLAVKSRLSALDAFETSNDLEPHGIMTRDLDRSVKRFQREKGLKVDGLLFPNGETENALTQARKQRGIGVALDVVSGGMKLKEIQHLNNTLSSLENEKNSLQTKLDRLVEDTDEAHTRRDLNYEQMDSIGCDFF